MLESVIKDPKGAGTTLPKSLSSGDFVKRLEKALEEEKSKGKHDKLNLNQFREVVLATANTGLATANTGL